jgi:iron complex outermembrane recepter protein
MTLNHNELSKSLRLALAIGAVSAAMFAQSPVAVAQNSGDQANAQSLAPVQVTGSRIKRTDLETAQPVLVVTQADIAATGLSQVGDILQNITTAGAALNQTFNNGGNGSTYVDLRDLGANRTLILVDGRRFAPDGQALSGIVDLNSIPTAIIERIEVLKDGASTIYGSDAIAGVINIITLNRFEGMEANAYFGETDEGDGRAESYDFTMGAASDTTSLIVSASFTKNEPIFAGDRDISAVPQFGADFCASSTSPIGRFGLTGRTGTFTLTNPAPTGPGVVQNANNIRPFVIPGDCYNFAPDNYLVTPQERHSIFAKLRHNIFDNVTFRADLVYTNRESDQLLAAIPVTFAGNGLFGGNVRFDVSPQSFYNPFGVATTRVQRRLTETGGRNFIQDVDVWHFNGGFEGFFNLGERTFSWDVGYGYSKNQDQDITRGQVNVNRIATAVGPSFRNAQGQILCGTPTAVITGCVPLNLFGGPGSITPEMLAYISTPLQDYFEYQRTSYTANISSDLFSLPAGPLAFAAGYEYRTESGFDLPDALTATGASSGNIRQPTSGGFSVDEFYAEFNVPILADVPGAELLELNVAGRYSDYNTFGDTSNFKAGLRWKPFSDLLVRGNYSEGFRAPSIAELFQGQSDNFADVSDPCTGPGQATTNRFATLTAAQRQNCINAGVPATGAEQASGQIRSTVGGNPNLAPETSESKTFGMVYSPAFLPGFDVSLDWWNIEIEDSITTLGAQTIADACILGGAATQCALIQRLPGTGAIAGLLDVNTNGASDEIEGYDVTANYRYDADTWGKFRFTLDTTYLAKYINVTESGIPGQPLVYSLVGNYYGRGAYTARIKSNFTVGWDLNDWGASWTMRYVSRMQEDCSGAVDPANQCSAPDGTPFNVDGLALNGLEVVPTNILGATTYNDVQVRWNAPWNGTISGGIRNVLDKDPPISISTFANSFDPSFDVPGRFFYVSYKQKF